MEAKAFDGGLELGAPAKARVALDLGQPLSALAAPVAKHSRSASRAHPAEESMDPPAVPFLRLIGAFDRASLQKHEPGASDTVSITSSRVDVPCGIHRPVLYSAAGSRQLPQNFPIQYELSIALNYF